jgi:hypothetical protein
MCTILINHVYVTSVASYFVLMSRARSNSYDAKGPCVTYDRQTVRFRYSSDMGISGDGSRNEVHAWMLRGRLKAKCTYVHTDYLRCLIRRRCQRRLIDG